MPKIKAKDLSAPPPPETSAVFFYYQGTAGLITHGPLEMLKDIAATIPTDYSNFDANKPKTRYKYKTMIGEISLDFTYVIAVNVETSYQKGGL